VIPIAKVVYESNSKVIEEKNKSCKEEEQEKETPQVIMKMLSRSCISHQFYTGRRRKGEDCRTYKYTS
jgi:hypothetical protein